MISQYISEWRSKYDYRVTMRLCAELKCEFKLSLIWSMSKNENRQKIIWLVNEKINWLILGGHSIRGGRGSVENPRLVM